MDKLTPEDFLLLKEAKKRKAIIEEKRQKTIKEVKKEFEIKANKQINEVKTQYFIIGLLLGIAATIVYLKIRMLLGV